MTALLEKDYVHTFEWPFDDIWFKMSPAFRALVDAEIINLDTGVDMPYRCNGIEEVTFELDGPWLGSDYSGDDITESNQRSLLRDYPQFLSGHTKFSGHYGYGLQVDPWFGWGDEDEQAHALDLVGVLVGLKQDYPLYDEDDNSRLIMERAEHAWESYYSRDLSSDIERLTGIDLDLTTDEAKTLFWDTCMEYDIYPEAEGHRDVLLHGVGDDEFLMDLARRVLDEQGPEFQEYLYDLTDEGYQMLGEYMAKEAGWHCEGQVSLI